MTDVLPVPAARWRWVRFLLTIAALGAGGAGQFWLTVGRDPAAAALAWAAAAAAFVAAFALSGRERDLPGPGATDLSPRAEWIWLAVVLTIGVFFIVYRYDEIPAGLNHDAAWEGLYALRILNGEPYTAYAREAWGRETLTFYFRAVSIWWMGPTALAVVVPSMVAGVLMLPFFYGWLRSLFGARLALIATLFLAAAGWHLVFSRTGWRSDFQPLFMAATCYFFFRGMQRRRALDFALAGLALALTLNTYNAARVFPAVFGLWLLIALPQSWTLSGFVRRYGVGLGFMGLAFAVAIAPLAWFAYHHWDAFMGRATALRGATAFADAARATLLLFNFSGNGDDFFVREPALEFPAAVLFVFGLLWTLLRIRDPRAQFLWIGILVGLVPGMVSAPNLNRNVGTMIFVFAFVGLGALFFARQLRALAPRAGAALSLAFLIGVGGAAVGAGYREYLSDDRRSIWGYYPETTVLGRYMSALVPDYDIWVGGANFPRDTLTYLTYQGAGNPMQRNYTWVDDVRVLLRLPQDARGAKGRAFILAAHGEASAVFSALARRYPDAEIVDLPHPQGRGAVFARALLVAGDQAEGI